MDKIVLIELTDRCNLNCIMCSDRKKPHGIEPGYMDANLFRAIVDELAQDPDHVSFEMFWLGESLLHPQFDHMIGYLREKLKNTDHTANLHTNGTYLRDHADALLSLGTKLPFMTISIDAASQETYSIIRKGNYSGLLHGIHDFLRARKALRQIHPIINFQFILMQENHHDVPEFIDYWSRYLAPLSDPHCPDKIYLKRVELHDIQKQKQADRLFSKIIADNGLYSSQMGSIELISRDRDQPGLNDDYWFEKKTARRPCAAIWKNPCIRWDGELTMCCFDNLYLYPLGNVRDGFNSIWDGRQLRQIRAMHALGRFGDVLTIHREKKCENCIGYYHPPISDEEVIQYFVSAGNIDIAEKFRARIA
ncbi:MAG: radical SAM protein [archaeon]